MAQITKKNARAPTIKVVPGDYTGIQLSLRRRLSLRLIVDGTDKTPKPLVHETQLLEDVQEALQTPPTAPHISEITGRTSSLHVTKSAPLEFTSVQEPFTESEIKNFVLFDESAICGESAEILPLPSSLCHLLKPQEPEVPENPPPCSNIVITLRETATIFHLNLPPLNVDVTTEAGKAVESDNEYYEYITVGKGCLRNTKMAEVQTEYSVRKTRSTVALTVGVKDSSSSANAWDLYHSYKKLDSV
jgi:hypothetical protein